MANEIVLVGTESYLVMMDEATGSWGDFPGASGSGAAGAYYHVPVNSYSVKGTRKTRNSQAYTGTHQRKHASAFGTDVAGQLVTHLHGWKPSGQTDTLAKKMLDWAFLDYELNQPASKGAEWAEGPNISNRRHTGLRVNTASLVATMESGEMVLSLDLIGRQEFNGPTAQTLPVDREKILDMQAVDCTLVLDGVTVKPTTFQWQLNRNLQALRVNDWFIHALVGQMRDETFTVTLPKSDAKFDTWLRTQSDIECTATMTMRGLHNGTGSTGNYSLITVVFNRLYFQNQDNTGDKGIILQPLTFQCLKPDSASNVHTVTYSEV